MMQKKHILAKCASGILSFSMIMSTIPSIPAWAEEEFADDGLEMEAEMDIEDTELDESFSVFYITGFPDFEKDTEGHFIKEETRTQYSDLKAVPGTLPEDLPLPEDLNLNGYWEADGPEIPSTLTLEDISWKLKSDTGEFYSESSPEGDYTFVPDYDEYLSWHEELDNLVLPEDVKDLELTIAITSEQTAAESEAETGAENAVPEDMNTEVPADLSDVDLGDSAADSGEISIPTDSDSADSDSADSNLADPEPDPAPADDSGENSSDDLSQIAGDLNDDVNIFDNLDDSAIDADSQEEYSDSPEDPAADADTFMDPSQNAPSVVLDLPSNETETESETTSESESEDTGMPSALGSTSSLSGTLRFYNPEDTVPLYEYPTDENGSITVTLDSTASIPAIQLPCSAVLNQLSIQFVTTDTSTAFDLSAADFSDGATKTLSFTDGSTVFYMDLTLTKAAHNFDNATCQHLATCQNCFATTGDYAAHVSANNATCVKNATCSICSAELSGTALGHDWMEATCTTPKTCSRCQATEGAALGHDLHDDWETIEESSYTSHGYQERICHRDSCDYSESRELNIIGNPADNAIWNLKEGAVYDVNSRLTFSAYGAASENTSPIANDVRYIPSTWSIQDTAGTWLDNYSGAFSISKTGTYTVTVTFQKQVYENGSWKNTDIADSRTVTFSIGGASANGSNDAVRINPQTGDQTPILPFVIILAAAAIIIIAVLVIRRRKDQ